MWSFFYSASVLDKLQGGAYSLFRGIQALQRLLVLAFVEIQDYSVLHIQNTTDGIEVVMAMTVE